MTQEMRKSIGSYGRLKEAYALGERHKIQYPILAFYALEHLISDDGIRQQAKKLKSEKPNDLLEKIAYKIEYSWN